MESYLMAKGRPGGFTYPIRCRSHIIGPIDGSIIEELKEREQGGVILPARRHYPEMPFVRDERVVLNSISLIGIEAIFQEYLPEKHRILVLMNILGRETVVPLDINDVTVGKLAFA
jgi:transcription antitermination factor NusG